MKLTFNKKDLLSFLDFPLPKNAEDPCLVLKTEKSSAIGVISHPLFTLTFPFEATIEEEGEMAVSFHDAKKAILSTKAKEPVRFDNGFFKQDKEWLLSESKPYPELAATTVSPKMPGPLLAEALMPLPLFTTKDALFPWREKVAIESTPTGLHFSQCSGVHLVQSHVFSPLETPIGKCLVDSYLMEIFIRLLPLFNTGTVCASEESFGFYGSPRKSFILKSFQQPNLPSFTPPVPSENALLYLNPINKKPFEKVFYNELRSFKDKHLLEYPDLSLTLKVEALDDAYQVDALVFSENESEATSLVTTTSPFFNGVMPDVWLPPYDLIKAMGKMAEITSFQITDRGVWMKFMKTEELLFETQVFLHGRKPQKA